MEQALTLDAGPLRVGVDAASIRQVRGSYERHGQRYLDRIFTALEVEQSSVDGIPDATRLAACFAAKEAMLKVLAPTAENPAWNLIELHRPRPGSPFIVLHGSAAHLADLAGLREAAVSISNEGDLVVAMVVGTVDAKRPALSVTES